MEPKGYNIEVFAGQMSLGLMGRSGFSQIFTGPYLGLFIQAIDKEWIIQTLNYGKRVLEHVWTILQLSNIFSEGDSVRESGGWGWGVWNVSLIFPPWNFYLFAYEATVIWFESLVIKFLSILPIKKWKTIKVNRILSNSNTFKRIIGIWIHERN